MRIHELLESQQALEEGPKTRAAALAAMLGAGALTPALMKQADKTPVPAPIQQTQQMSKQDTPEPQARTSIANLKPNTAHAKEPKPFVPEDHLKTLISIAKQMGITDRNDLAGLLAQCSVETRQWAKATEQFTYSTPEILRGAYTSRFPSIAAAELYLDSGEVAIANRALANKNGNGDEASGDGWRYRGRGFIHITGRELYAKAGAALHPKDPDIYVNHPEILSSNPTESAKATVWYYLRYVGKGKTAAQASAKINPAGLKAGERNDMTQQYKQKLAALSQARR